MAHSLFLNPVVSAEDQVVALSAVLKRVSEVVVLGITPVVEIDLDLTSLLPVERTRLALVEVGEKFGLTEFISPSPDWILPGYTDEAWDAFVAEEQLQTRYPKLFWGRVSNPPTPYSTFHAAYWKAAWLELDDPTPGLGEFVRRIEDRGGIVVFLSGRWRVDQIPPTRDALQKAGIADPLLLIGNPRHEKNVVQGELPWSDARLKGQAQEEIRTLYGLPVAVFDDRESNRKLVIDENKKFHEALGLSGVLGIGVAIPGFTSDPATAKANFRVSTFESGRPDGCDPRREPYLAVRYGCLPEVSYRGLITGCGRNARGYILPRRMPNLAFFTPPSGYEPRFAEIAKLRAGSLTDAKFIDAAEKTLPDQARKAIMHALEGAKDAAADGLAHPFPTDPSKMRDLWRTLVCSWLHSRDMEVVMAAIGYPLVAEGVHDMTEMVPAADVITAIVRSLDSGNLYSEWFLRWVNRLDRTGTVNVDFLNPHLVVGTWQWREGVKMPQDAMDAHRVSAHHQGDGAERYDPIEATINNLLHAREGIYGVQKTPVITWEKLKAESKTVAGSIGLAKSGWGGGLFRDAIQVVEALEKSGHIMPWSVVCPIGMNDGGEI